MLAWRRARKRVLLWGHPGGKGGGGLGCVHFVEFVDGAAELLLQVADAFASAVRERSVSRGRECAVEGHSQDRRVV